LATLARQGASGRVRFEAAQWLLVPSSKPRSVPEPATVALFGLGHVV
jgi:hypothetical protein